MAEERAAAATAEGEGGEDTTTEKNVTEGAGEQEVTTEGDKPEVAPAEKPDDDGEPPVRGKKSAKDYIIERKQRQIEKAKAKASDGDVDAELPSSEDLSPADEEILERAIEKKLSPFLAQQEEAATNSEINEFLSANPDFKEFEGKVRKYASHPSRRNIPVSSIFYEVAGPSLMKMGAKRSKAADEKAKEGQAGGGAVRGEDAAAKGAWEMPKDKFNERVQNALNKRE